MKSTAIITTAILLSCIIAEGQYAGHNRATHIIKLKSTMNMTTGNTAEIRIFYHEI